jgi:hypothetical protein
MVLPGIFGGVQQRQRLLASQPGQAQSFVAVGVELLAIALAEVAKSIASP